MLDKIYKVTALCILGLLAACANVAVPAASSESDRISTLPQFPHKFGSRPAIEAPDAVQLLTAEQQQDFLAYFNAPQNQSVKPYTRLANYLFEHTLSLQFEAHTYTAAQTLDLNKGDCLSLAILTTALARLANV